MNVGVPTGLAANSDTVTPPMPVASAVVPSLVTAAVPDWLDDVPPDELAAPFGGDGADGTVLGGAGGPTAGAVGVTEFEAPDGDPVPTPLTAATVNVYAVPLLRPVTLSVVAAELKLCALPAVDPTDGVTT